MPNIFSAVLLLSALAAGVQAIPSRGHYPFAVALCKASDRSAEPITVTKVRQFFTSAGSSTPGMYNFFREQSSNTIDFEGSVIGGWYTIPHTYAEIATYNRQQRLQVCLDAATKAGFTIPSTHKHMALYNTASDMGEVGGGGGGVVLQADYHFGISLAGHEVMHTLGEPHSRTASQTAPPVEYGDSFDLMSTEDVYTSYDDGVYSTSGPNLCAPARDRMGWIAMDRIYTPPNNAYKVSLKLTSLSLNPSTTSGYLMSRIPIYTKAGQPFAYYTVELRTATGFDRGIPNLGNGNSGIVIHRVNETDQANWLFLARYAAGSKPYSWSYQPGDQFLDLQGGVQIKVISIASDLQSAQLEITASGNPPHIFYGPNTCKQGLVWREGDKLDYTCVTPARRTKVASDNQLCASRILSNGYCKQGWVWREAWPGDHCCVEPAERSTAQGETRAAYTGVASDYTSLSSFASAPLSPVIP